MKRIITEIDIMRIPFQRKSILMNTMIDMIIIKKMICISKREQLIKSKNLRENNSSTKEPLLKTITDP